MRFDQAKNRAKKKTGGLRSVLERVTCAFFLSFIFVSSAVLGATFTDYVNMANSNPVIAAGRDAMWDCISQHENGGDSLSKANSDYYYSDGHGGFTYAGVRGANCPSGTKDVSCLPLSSGGNQNNYSVDGNLAAAEGYLIQHNLLSSKGSASSISYRNSIASMCGLNAGCESFMESSRMSMNAVIAYNYMKDHNIEMTDQNWYIYGQQANWAPACLSSSTYYAKHKASCDSHLALWAKYSSDCKNSGQTHTITDTTVKEYAELNKKVLDCGGYKDVAQGLLKSVKAFRSSQWDDGEKTTKSLFKSFADSNSSGFKDYKGDRYKCLGYKYRDFFKALLDFITDWASTIKKLLIQLVETILTKICSVVADAINSVLSMICIPLPSTSLGLGAPELGLSGCNGVSLSDFVTITSGSPTLASLGLISSDSGSDSSDTGDTSSAPSSVAKSLSSGVVPDALTTGKQILRDMPTTSGTFF